MLLYAVITCKLNINIISDGSDRCHWQHGHMHATVQTLCSAQSRVPKASLLPCVPWQATTEAALAAADGFMSAAGYQPRAGPQGLPHKYRFVNDGLPHGINAAAARGKRVVPLGGSSGYNRQPPPPKRGRRH